MAALLVERLAVQWEWKLGEKMVGDLVGWWVISKVVEKAGMMVD